MEFLAWLSDFLWNVPLFIVLLGGSVYLFFLSRGRPLLLLPQAIKALSMKASTGAISPFQGLTNAISNTVGLGNIVGVTIAIQLGGAGVLFWMWLSSLLGMVAKYYETDVAIRFAKKFPNGMRKAGLMYLIETVKGPKALGVFFAVCGLFATLPIFNGNQLTQLLSERYQLSPVGCASILTIALLYINHGGLKRISNVTSMLVPFMGLIYLAFTLIVLLSHASLAFETIGLVFQKAFQPEPLLGASFFFIIQTGIKRAAFSNEAGVGTAPMAHGDNNITDPSQAGAVSMLGPLCDILMVTCTGILILMFSTVGETFLPGIGYTVEIFARIWPVYGPHFLSLIVVCFAFSTLIGGGNYCRKCYDYLVPDGPWKKWGFHLYYGGAVMIGCLSQVQDVLNTIDIAYALMAFPNMYYVIKLARR